MIRYGKYNNKKVTVDGIDFDSIKESIRYKQLKLLQRAGLIKDLKLQVSYTLQPSFKSNGQTIRSIKYIADFDYFTTKDNRHILEDVKSPATAKDKTYILKKKMLLYKYQDIVFKEII